MGEEAFNREIDRAIADAIFQCCQDKEPDDDAPDSGPRNPRRRIGCLADVGCGPGYLVERLLELGVCAFGYDSNAALMRAPEAVKHATTIVDLREWQRFYGRSFVTCIGLADRDVCPPQLLIDNLTRCKPETVVWSSSDAEPWMKRFREAGYDIQPNVTIALRLTMLRAEVPSAIIASIFLLQRRAEPT